MTKPSIKKQEKENNILLGLVELYIQTGKPIGSNTLKESGFDHLSSATIRNYFFKLEEQGFLSQQHSSVEDLLQTLLISCILKIQLTKNLYQKPSASTWKKSFFIKAKKLSPIFIKS